jgi:hypothetical protein
MTKDDYRAAIAGVGLTPTSAARFFRVNERLARRWAKGDLPIPYSVRLSLKLMIRLELTAIDVVREELNQAYALNESPEAINIQSGPRGLVAAALAPEAHLDPVGREHYGAYPAP